MHLLFSNGFVLDVPLTRWREQFAGNSSSLEWYEADGFETFKIVWDEVWAQWVTVPMALFGLAAILLGGAPLVWQGGKV